MIHFNRSPFFRSPLCSQTTKFERISIYACNDTRAQREHSNNVKKAHAKKRECLGFNFEEDQKKRRCRKKYVVMLIMQMDQKKNEI